MKNHPCILVIDDDAEICEMLAEYLARQAFAVRTAPSGAAARAIMAEHTVALVVLDLRLPDEDGLSLARFLRERYTVGILMLTGANEVIDRIVGLEVGADDYLAKPFDPREVVARIKSVLRRMAGVSPSSLVAATPIPHGIRIGRCLLNLQMRTLQTLEGQEVPLTSMEFDLLHTFVMHPQQVLSRDRLLELAHQREWEPCNRSLDIRVTRLRRKIEVEPANPQIIKTIWGTGYMFVPSHAA
jgi:two-component system phosphate regulon response regulator OmpR